MTKSPIMTTRFSHLHASHHYVTRLLDGC